MSDDPFYQALRAQLVASVHFLQDMPEETADSTLQALWHRAAGVPLSARMATATPLRALTDAEQQILRRLVGRRIEGVPLAHITGRQSFMGLEMLAEPGALVPRHETELLAGVAIDLARSAMTQQGSCTVVDACTGSGNVALSIAHRVTGARVLAADLSEDAIALAVRNAHHLGLSAQFEPRVGDLLAPFDQPALVGQIDVMTCNPPYISTARVAQMRAEIAEHEPRMAFDGGHFGVSILMRLLQDAPRYLRPGGWLAFEVGLGQGPPMLKRMQGLASFAGITPHENERGEVRAISAWHTGLDEKP